MNKLLSSIIGGFLGASMITAVSVGIGVGNNADFKEAKAENYTITFGNSANSASQISASTRATTVISNGTDYVTSQPFTVNSGKAYYGDTKTCIRIGKSGKTSSLSIALSSSGSVRASTISVNCRYYNDANSGATLSVNGSSAQTTASSDHDYVYTINSDITSITLAGSKAICINSITVSYSSGGDVPEDGDTITAADLAATGSAYTPFSGVSKPSGAAYLGCTAKNSSNIQINSGNTSVDGTSYNRGIGSSISGGIIRKITVVWGGSNTNGRYLTVHGSNTAYTSTTLSSGTSLGTISYSTGDTTDVFGPYTTADYSYVSIVASNALYISSITFEWEAGETPTTYESSDTIIRYTTGIPNGSNTYAAWSGVKLTSGAIYAGKSAGSYNAIQINTSKSDSGIVTTASGGNVKSIVINFSANTTDGRKVVVYGKASAYESPEDLFSSSTRGTSIGEATYTEGTTSYTITPTSSSEYIGIRSSGNAIYIDSIVITWTSTTKPNTVASLTVTSQPTNTTFGVGEKLDLTGLVVTASYEESGVSSEATMNYSTDPVDGYTFVAGDIGSKTITISSRAKPSITTSLTVTVVNAYPVSLTKTSPFVFSTTMTFAEGTGTVKATLTDGSEVTGIRVGDVGTTLTIGGETVSASTLASDYANQYATLSYTSNNKTVTYTFKVVVEDDLLVDHFDDVPSYVLSGESATIEAHYTSFIGKPDVEVVALESDYLSVDFDESNVTYDSTTNVGLIPFTVTGGTTPGQYTISVTISKDGKEASNTCSLIVRTAAPGHEGSGEYELVTSLNDVTSGKYVIAANVDGTYLSMSDAFDSTHHKFPTNEITVENNLVTSEEFSIFNLVRDGNNITIENDGKYVRYSGSSTNMSFEENNPYNWTISATTSGVGTFRLLASTTSSETTKRALGYHAPWGDSANNVFGPYSITNYHTSTKSASYEYYEIELFKYNGSEEEDTGAEEFELIRHFVDSYMHMDDIAITNTSDTGACRGTNGYYLIAKAAWHAMASSYHGEHDLVAIFTEKFPDAYQRYITWAEKNGDTQPFVGSTIVPAKAITNITDNGSAPVMVIAISLLTTFSISGYFVLKKKRLHK